MATFRKKNNNSDNESSNGSGNEDNEAMTERLTKNLNDRQKAIARRRLPKQQNDDAPGQQEGDERDEKGDGIQEGAVNPSSNAGKLWAETAVMQNLEEKIGVGSASTIADLRDRGVETYALDLGKNKFNLSQRKRRRDDDISDLIWDEQMEVGADGPKSDEGGKNDKEMDEAKDVKVDPVADLWDGVDTGAVELPVERHFGRWRHQHGRNRGGNFKKFKRDSNEQEGDKGNRKQQQHGNRGSGNKNQKNFLPPAQFLPKRLVAPSYDQTKFFGTVLDPAELDEEQLVAALVEALGEKEPAVIAKAVHYAGKQLAVDLFKECQEVEKRGGMLTKREDRRKAPGGVFLQLFNQCEGIPPENKKALFELGAELMAKSRGGSSSRWWNKKKNKTEGKEKREDTKKAESPPPLIENEELPRCNAILKPDVEACDCDDGPSNGEATV